MRDDASKKANNYLHSNSRELQTVFSKIKELADWQAHLIPHLDANLRSYCQVANVIGHRLVLLVSNGTIATQIRFQTPDLIKKFKQDPKLTVIHDIHCKVRPSDTPIPRSNRKVKRMAPLSAETSEIVAQTAQSLTDPTLRAIMERIAKHTK